MSMKRSSPTRGPRIRVARGRSALSAYTALTCWLAWFAPSAASAESIVGVPQSGAKGVRESVSQIMERQKVANRLGPRPPRLMPEHEHERDDLPQNPEAPRVAQWPPSTGQPRTGGSRSPQTADVSFTGATLADTGAFPPD